MPFDPEKALSSAEAVREKWQHWGWRMKVVVTLLGAILLTFLVSFTGEHVASCVAAWKKSETVSSGQHIRTVDHDYSVDSDGHDDLLLITAPVTVKLPNPTKGRKVCWKNTLPPQKPGAPLEVVTIARHASELIETGAFDYPDYGLTDSQCVLSADGVNWVLTD